MILQLISLGIALQRSSGYLLLLNVIVFEDLSQIQILITEFFDYNLGLIDSLISRGIAFLFIGGRTAQHGRRWIVIQIVRSFFHFQKLGFVSL